MKKGELAKLVCRADYAYGAAGSPPTIPPDATLQFEVELISWKSVKDITGTYGWVVQGQGLCKADSLILVVAGSVC